MTTEYGPCRLHSLSLAASARMLIGTEIEVTRFGVYGYKLVSLILGQGLTPAFPRFASVWKRYGDPARCAPGVVAITRNDVGIVLGENYTGDRLLYVTERGGQVVQVAADKSDCMFRCHPAVDVAATRIVCTE